MKVICAGVPKTGTTSMAEALRILGYETYDFKEQITFFLDEWHDMFTYGKKPDFQAMFKDIDAVTDTPSSFVFDDLYESFPDAKVILTIRDNEQVWGKSYSKHLNLVSWWIMMYHLISNRKLHRVMLSLLDFLGGRNPNSSFAHIKQYQWYNERVQQIIPKDRLLIYNVRQGWKPLCEFLGREVPDEQFPRANVGGADFKRYLSDTLKKILLIVAFFVLGVGIIVFFLLG